MSSSSSLSSVVCHHFSLDEIKDATNNFDESNILGRGGEGTVYLGHIAIGGDDEKFAVAVKLLNPNSNGFENEIKIVSKIKHPNVVSLLGYCNELDQKILVYEYMQKGSLSDYVKKNISICLSWKQRLNICLGVAGGLQYLHTATVELPKGIIHRDMKPANILLDKNWVAKVSDFGMFKLSHADQTNSTMITGLKGTRGYFAPECVRNNEITRKTDVYAFGVVMFEMLCQKKPWDRGDDQSYYVRDDEDLGLWAMENADTEINGEISDDSLEIFVDIVGRSLRQNPDMRPTMDEVVLDLERALKCQEHDDHEGIRPKALSGRRASIPSRVQKLIENIKEITGNEDDEIYAMLKESSMDSVQTIRKLLFQGRSLQPKPGMRPTMDEVVLDLEKPLKCQERDDHEGIRPQALSGRRASIPTSVQKPIENIKEITGRASIPSSVQKPIENIKEITGNEICSTDHSHSRLQSLRQREIQQRQRARLAEYEQYAEHDEEYDKYEEYATTAQLVGSISNSHITGTDHNHTWLQSLRQREIQPRQRARLAEYEQHAEHDKEYDKYEVYATLAQLIGSLSNSDITGTGP